jgi:serine protease inhibitor
MKGSRPARGPGKAGKQALALAAAVLLIMAWSTVRAGGTPPGKTAGQAPAVSDHAGADGASSLNAFCLNLYSCLKTREGNLFFSPWSIASSLAPAYEGARGKTRTGMSRALGFPAKPEDFSSSFSGLTRALSSLDHAQGLDLKDARSLWVDEGYGLRKAYLGEVKSSLGASLFKADFRHDPEGSRARINAWVKEATAGMIEELLEKGMVSSGTGLVIADGLYFSGLWRAPFDPKNTHGQIFHKDDGGEVSVPMMDMVGRFRTLTRPGVRMIELPYGEGGVSMVILLPEEVRGLRKLEEKLDPRVLGSFLDALASAREGEVALRLPRFNLSSSFELGKALSSMGMRQAFAPGADFSGMTGVRGLFISLLVHKARVEVDEKGTRASAATGVVMTKAVRVPTVFSADHSFLFLIRERGTGAILFMGRLADPSRG